MHSQMDSLLRLFTPVTWADTQQRVQTPVDCHHEHRIMDDLESDFGPIASEIQERLFGLIRLHLSWSSITPLRRA
jgi:hypothetical protein